MAGGNLSSSSENLKAEDGILRLDKRLELNFGYSIRLAREN
jgi:hypothetical protein